MTYYVKLIAEIMYMFSVTLSFQNDRWCIMHMMPCAKNFWPESTNRFQITRRHGGLCSRAQFWVEDPQAKGRHQFCSGSWEICTGKGDLEKLDKVNHHSAALVQQNCLLQWKRLSQAARLPVPIVTVTLDEELGLRAKWRIRRT